MIQLVIKNDRVIAFHAAYQRIAEFYPDCEIVDWNGLPSQLQFGDGTTAPDPRTQQEKDRDAASKATREATARMPSERELLYLLYLDQKDGTTKFRDTIDARVQQTTTRS